MGRPPTGKPLKLRPVRLDDDVWNACQEMGKEHGTINQGLRASFGWEEGEGAEPRVLKEVSRVKAVADIPPRPDWRKGRKPLLKPGDKKR